MVVKGPTEKAGPNGIAKFTTLFSMKFKIRFIGAQVHRLTAAREFKGPRSRFHPGFKLELSSKAGANRSNSFGRFEALTFV